MKEEFLHYLWKYSLYETSSLIDGDGNPITVISPGEYNRDSGPDFFNARIVIAGTEWAGNVEIHIKASHFNAHGHDRDHAFDNVILHVVAEKDLKVYNANNEELLTTEIKFDPELYRKYIDLVNNPCAIACRDELKGADSFLLRSWLNSLLIERLQMKSEAVMKIWTATGNDWDETFYRVLSRYFGFRVNTEPFEMLATALPFRIIRKHADNRLQIEALLFGSAGMLEEGLFKNALSDQYYVDLIREYKVLSAKYSLRPIHGWLWKFCRLRPVNFPTVRLSQLAALLSTAGGLFSRTLAAGDVSQLKDLFGVAASSYWDNHYIFGKESKRSGKHTGDQASDILLINAVMPMIFIYGRTHDDRKLCDRALDLLADIDPERNSVIRDWTLAGMVPESAFDTQALIQLTDEYCSKRKCLDCRIGSSVISSGKLLKNREQLTLEP
ncbi:MAG: DUF2851 family protein [Bacteroidales bacterium]|jgi:hypothetical protein|nr:DUF2851 family protein [Bacteroidales bacterium]